MNDIKYPKTELFVVLGSKVYPLYTTLSPEDVYDKIVYAEREELLDFEVAVRKNHVLWYPDCHENPIWSKWTTQKRTIKSYLELPKPKVNIDYGYEEEDF